MTRTAGAVRRRPRHLVSGYPPAEWNNCQPTRIKIILSENPLRETVTADGPISLKGMFEVGNFAHRGFERRKRTDGGTDAWQAAASPRRYAQSMLQLPQAYEKSTSMNEDRFAVTGKNLGGHVEQGFGRVTGDVKTEVEGKMKQACSLCIRERARMVLLEPRDPATEAELAGLPPGPGENFHLLLNQSRDAAFPGFKRTWSLA